MNVSTICLQRLTSYQHAQLEKLIQFLDKQFQISFINCFGLRNSTATLQNCFTGEQHTASVLLNLLVVHHEATECFVSKAQSSCEKFSDHNFKVSLTAFSMVEAIERLTAGDAFLNKVYQEGLILYAKDHELPLIPSSGNAYEEEVKEIENTTTQWNAIGNHFLDCAKYCLSTNKFDMSIFMLHQAIENTCKTIIRLLTNYRTKHHNLCWMLKICSTLEPEMTQLFPKNTKRERELFKLLQRSYLDFRYSDSFRVHEQDAWVLFEKTHRLFTIGEHICNQKLQQARNKGKPLWPFEVENMAI